MSAMEGTLQYINGNFISLPPEEITENNEVLDKVLNTIIEGCKETDDLFASLYSGLFYGGSYYDGLKIGRPDEYDIDVKFVINYQGPIDPSNKNGYVNLKLKRVQSNDRALYSKKHGIWRPYYGEPKLHQLTNFNDDYLDTEKVMIWMHRVLSTSLNKNRRGWKIRRARIAFIDTDYGEIKVKFSRHGPAFTFRTTGFEDGRVICFDLVPCFVFGEDKWPPCGFRPNPVPDKASEFFIVPKPSAADTSISTRYFRLSFQEQERILLKDKGNLKPALRLIKKVRDKLNHDVIASYFIKTLFLWEVFSIRKPNFWWEPLSHVFIEILKDYQKCIQKRYIGYFWYRKFNLIGDINKTTLKNINKDLKSVLKQLENEPDNPELVAKLLLSRREMRLFREDYLEN